VDQLLLRFKTNSRRCSFVLRLKLFLRLIPTAKLSTITQFLLQLTNLRNLYLKAPNSIIHPLLHGCSFQLQIFKYYNDDSPDKFDYLPVFLALQLHLQRLTIRNFLSRTELVSTALPALRILDGPANLIKTVLPGRSVERLPLASLDAPSLGKGGPYLSVKVLRILSLSPNFSGIEEVFPNLHYLECIGVWGKVRLYSSSRVSLNKYGSGKTYFQRSRDSSVFKPCAFGFQMTLLVGTRKR